MIGDAAGSPVPVPANASDRVVGMSPVEMLVDNKSFRNTLFLFQKRQVRHSEWGVYEERNVLSSKIQQEKPIKASGIEPKFRTRPSFASP